MKLHYLTTLLYGALLVSAAPPTERDALVATTHDAATPIIYELEKRKGGGGGGGRGSSGGGGGTGRGSSGSGGSGTGGRASTNDGGRTRSGSGTPPAYGNRYTGGAVEPYRSGLGRVAPFALLPVALLPGLWLYSAWAYNYPAGYRYRNNGQERSCNVTCLCSEDSVCGCDPDVDSDFIGQVLTNNGTSPNGIPVNSTDVINILYPNGTCLSYINGTLEDGTTASGGTDDLSPASKLVIDYGGYWLMLTTVMAAIMMI